MKTKKKKKWFKIISFVALVLVAAVICLPGGVHLNIPKPHLSFEKKAPFIKLEKVGTLLKYDFDLDVKQGLDLQGGSHLVYKIDLSKVASGDKKDAVSSLQKVIENRVNAYGVAEPTVYTSTSGSESRITVELPGVKNTEQAMDLIGKTAQLEFKEENSTGTDYQATGITGSDLSRAEVAFDQTTGKPYISITFTGDGAKKFQNVTARNTGKTLAIYLDSTIVSAPTVNQEISGGKAQITGSFNFTEAKNLAIQLNAGRLPAPISLVEQRTVEATLGQSSIRLSIFAGILAIAIVSLFMIIYYRALGIFSTIGLALYLLFTVALFKILGITVTMGGIAGLILSIGMSMETDVLVFERIREEMRNGRNFEHAFSLGFSRAWSSIKDSNIVSLIICGLLIWDGGTVRGFAIVLALGIFVGLTTTFLGTKILIEFLARTRIAKNNWYFNVEKEEKK